MERGVFIHLNAFLTLVFVAATMEQQKGKEAEMEEIESLEDVEVVQALVAEPAFKLDSSPSPYKVSVAIFCFPEILWRR